MSEQEILEGNKLIADFMQVDYSGKEQFMWRPGAYIPFTEKCLRYHSSWDWLMPVVEKIETDCKFDVHIYGHYNWKEPNRCVIIDWKNEEIVSTSNDSKSQCVFDAVVEFIKWYNNQIK